VIPWLHRRGDEAEEPRAMGEQALFRARLDQIIHMKHDLVQLADKLDWDRVDSEIAPFYSDKWPARDRDSLRHWAAVAQTHLRAGPARALDRVARSAG